MTIKLTPSGQVSRACAKPPRKLCERIAGEVATSFGLTFDNLINSRSLIAGEARTVAWARIIEETQCSRAALADAWGVNRKAVVEAMAAHDRDQAKGMAA